MGTRSGDLDPGVLVYLIREKKFDGAMLEDLVDHRSGLLGISGVGSDMRRLREAASSNADARLAIEMFCYSVRKQVAAMIAALGGVDMIVFTGGIGENDIGSASGDLWRLDLARRQPRPGPEPVRKKPNQRPGITLCGVRSPVAGRRADRPSYKGIVLTESFDIILGGLWGTVADKDLKMPKPHKERNRAERIGWLRAAVLGANDGIVSTASLVLGVAAAHGTRNKVLVAGVAGLVAGAMAMAAGEYVSVHSQADTEQAELT